MFEEILGIEGFAPSAYACERGCPWADRLEAAGPVEAVASVAAVAALEGFPAADEAVGGALAPALAAVLVPVALGRPVPGSLVGDLPHVPPAASLAAGEGAASGRFLPVWVSVAV